MVLTLARQAGDLGMTVLARKQIPWTEGDYRPQLRELRALDPEVLYFAGNQPVDVKVARQVVEILPPVHRLGRRPCMTARLRSRQTSGSGPLAWIG